MFKKLIMPIIMGLIMVTFTMVPSWAEDYYYDYFKMVKLVAGENIAQVNSASVTMDQAAYVTNGRSLVPFRFLGEALGANIQWDGQKHQATLNLGASEVQVTIGSKVAFVNGQLKMLDVPAEIKGGRTFIPLRFVSEALGAYVDYDPETRMIKVRYVDAQNWQTFDFPGGKGPSYKYPSNWTVETEKNGAVLTFTSPKGSKLWIYTLTLNPQDAVERYKQKAPDDKQYFLDEGLLDSNDPDFGRFVVFAEDTDNPQDPRMNFINFYNLEDKSSWVEDMLMLNSDVDMEWAVMNEILASERW